MVNSYVEKLSENLKPATKLSKAPEEKEYAFLTKLFQF